MSKKEIYNFYKESLDAASSTVETLVEKVQHQMWEKQVLTNMKPKSIENALSIATACIFRHNSNSNVSNLY